MLCFPVFQSVRAPQDDPQDGPRSPQEAPKRVSEAIFPCSKKHIKFHQFWGSILMDFGLPWASLWAPKRNQNRAQNRYKNESAENDPPGPQNDPPGTAQGASRTPKMTSQVAKMTLQVAKMTSPDPKIVPRSRYIALAVSLCLSTAPTAAATF